jgi:hypothetical protein
MSQSAEDKMQAEEGAITHGIQFLQPGSIEFKPLSTAALGMATAHDAPLQMIDSSSRGRSPIRISSHFYVANHLGAPMMCS